MEQLHPKAIWLFFWHYFFFGSLSGFFLILYALAFTIPLIGKIGVAWVFLFFSFFIFFIFIYLMVCRFFARLTYRYWRYELSENAVKIEKGIILKKYISIPYERVQNVDIYRGILDRLLGLSELHIQTAGYSGGYSGRGWGGLAGRSSEGRLPGLDPQKAEQLREELVARVKGTRQGL